MRAHTRGESDEDRSQLKNGTHAGGLVPTCTVQDHNAASRVHARRDLGNHSRPCNRHMPDEFKYAIRHYRETDAAALRALIAELQDSLTPIDDSLPRGAAMAPAYFAQTIESCRQRAGSIFVADMDGAVIGYVAVLTRVPFTSADTPAGEYAFVTDLAVGAPWRQRGIGTKLLSAAEAAARDNGAREMRLLVLVGNPAIDLYRRAGLYDYSITMRKRFDAS